jgi:prepilin-type processing-associated H-X9-DG protein
MAHILPQLGHNGLWITSVRACSVDGNPYNNPPHVGYATVVPTFVCPADSRPTVPMRTPSGHTVAFTSYIGNGGSFAARARTESGGLVRAAPGLLGTAPGVRWSEVLDGTSATILFGERPPPSSLQAGQWYQQAWQFEPFAGPDHALIYLPPTHFGDPCAVGGFGPGVPENPCDRHHYWSLHRSGANFAFADGSVRFLRHEADSILSALATRSGGESVEAP